MKCVLWYGFNTLEEKKYLDDSMMDKLSGKTIDNLLSMVLVVSIIHKYIILYNPEILGNGFLTNNLSDASASTIEKYSKSFTNLYQYTLKTQNQLTKVLFQIICAVQNVDLRTAVLQPSKCV